MASVINETYHKNPDFFKKLRFRWGKGLDIAVGIPKGGKSIGTRYPDGTPVLAVAFYNEFGTETIPARPFIKNGGRIATKKLEPILKKVIKAVNNDKAKLKNEFEKVGLLAEAIVKKYIVQLKSPPNAQSTIDAKGADNPLVDTNLMKNSITSQVRKKVK